MNVRKEDNHVFGADQPLKVGSAVKQDSLGREGFARQAAAIAERRSTSGSMAISIEGAWGSGKTSLLAMIEDCLCEKIVTKEIITFHFNPWLIGERDALLKQFLSQLASAIKLSPEKSMATKVAKAIEDYSTAFELLKHVPTIGDFLVLFKHPIEAWAKRRGANVDNLESRRKALSETLKALPSHVVVFIDDIDRLYPPEIFEMIRIIKAVADLPNVSYVLALDTAYVAEALGKLHVPNPHLYLDKIIQTRLPIPSISASAKTALLERGFSALSEQATASYFAHDRMLLNRLFHSGLRNILEHPRDITRLFNVVSATEPQLREEVVLADILAMAVLSTKATPVFDLLRQSPAMFLSANQNHDASNGSQNEAKALFRTALDAAYQRCQSPAAAREITQFLFPATAGLSFYNAGSSYLVQGRLAHPVRLPVALQLVLGDEDVSYVQVRRFLREPDARSAIVLSLSSDNCLAFMELLGTFAESLDEPPKPDIKKLCIDIATLADSPACIERWQHRHRVFEGSPSLIAMASIHKIAAAHGKDILAEIAWRIATEPLALSVAAVLVENVNKASVHHSDGLSVDDEKLTQARQLFARNVYDAAVKYRLFDCSEIHFVLATLARTASNNCPSVLEAMKQSDPSLDQFAASIVGSSEDSVKGLAFRFGPAQEAVLSAFVSLEEFRMLARNRLEDETVVFPLRSIWKAIFNGGKVYAADGSVPE